MAAKIVWQKVRH